MFLSARNNGRSSQLASRLKASKGASPSREKLAPGVTSRHDPFENSKLSQVWLTTVGQPSDSDRSKKILSKEIRDRHDPPSSSSLLPLSSSRYAKGGAPLARSRRPRRLAPVPGKRPPLPVRRNIYRRHLQAKLKGMERRHGTWERKTN